MRLRSSRLATSRSRRLAWSLTSASSSWRACSSVTTPACSSDAAADGGQRRAQVVGHRAQQRGALAVDLLEQRRPVGLLGQARGACDLAGHAPAPTRTAHRQEHGHREGVAVEAERVERRHEGEAQRRGGDDGRGDRGPPARRRPPPARPARAAARPAPPAESSRIGVSTRVTTTTATTPSSSPRSGRPGPCQVMGPAPPPRPPTLQRP